jgi:hypothetical protein
LHPTGNYFWAANVNIASGWFSLQKLTYARVNGRDVFLTVLAHISEAKITGVGVLRHHSQTMYLLLGQCDDVSELDV